MMKLNRVLALTGVAVTLALSSGRLAAQDRPGRGDFDPEQMRQRMMERYREQLEIKSDDEWKVIQPRIELITEARREVGFGGFGRGFGRRGGPGGPGGDQGDRGGRGGGFRGGDPSPEAEALQKAIEAKAPNDEIKAKLAKYREARKEKEAKLAKAQDELRQVLSVRQEASAVMMGLLP
jgi:hypothetical protein